MLRWIALAWTTLVIAACGDDSPASTTASTSDSGGSTTGTTPPGTDPGTGGDAETSSGALFVVPPDGGSLTQCNLYADDCPVGDKCMPYASDGGVVQDATRCVVVADDPGQQGDDCTVESWIASGIDDCARGHFCAVYDPVALEGRCLPLCIEDPELPDLTCFDPYARCVGPLEALPRLCATDCDPIGNDCPEGQGCYRINEHFSCLDDVSQDGGDYGEPCLFTNDCNPGMLCADPPEFFECPYPDGCCTPLCDVRVPDASAMCPGAPEHECVALFEDGEGSPLLDWIGACVVPSEDTGP